MRPSTEWVDTVEQGANVLVDDDPDAIEAAVRDASFPPARRRCTATACGGAHRGGASDLVTLCYKSGRTGSIRAL